MKKWLLLPVVWAVLATSGFGQELTINDLVGEWTFVSWMERDDETSKRTVNIQMEFRSDGTVINHLKKGDTLAHWTVDGSVITYTDERGEQIWQVLSFEPGQSLTVDHAGAIMLLEPSLTVE